MVIPKAILFLCDRNTVRSPMAAALLANAQSAGITADDSVDPFACAVMKEDQIDISAHTPRAVAPETLSADTLVIALSMPAFTTARPWREKTGFDLEYWDLPAVPGMDGGRDTILDGFRAIREALKGHIKNRFGAKPLKS